MKVIELEPKTYLRANGNAYTVIATGDLSRARVFGIGEAPHQCLRLIKRYGGFKLAKVRWLRVEVGEPC